MGRQPQLWKSKSCMQLHENLRPFQGYLEDSRDFGLILVNPTSI